MSETARTDANGDAVVTLRGTKAGEFTVTATLTRNNTVAHQQVTFIGDTNSAQLQPLTASLNTIVAGNSTGSTLTATIWTLTKIRLKTSWSLSRVTMSL